MKEYLTELVRILDKKEKHRYHDLDDIDNLFSEVYEKGYYKPILINSSFKSNYRNYESRGSRNKH